MKELEEHKCEVLKVELVEPKWVLYGPAIYKIIKTKHGWVAHNGEYGTIIYFCPFCGQKLD